MDKIDQVKKCCENCEMNNGVVCMASGERADNAGNTYGMPIEEADKMFPNGCRNWEIAFAVYQEMEKSK